MSSRVVNWIRRRRGLQCQQQGRRIQAAQGDRIRWVHDGNKSPMAAWRLLRSSNQEKAATYQSIARRHANLMNILDARSEH